jgi:predicted amidohydrolase YtcJ
LSTTAFVNGAVFDGRSYLGPCEVLVRDGRVVQVSGEVDRTAAVVVDLAGGLLAPGFIDAHVHAVQGGLERIRCDLAELASREAYLAAVRDYAATHPDVPWILGGGWSMPAFPGGTPTAADLDALVPDRPVFLPNRDHHGAWVNSVALRLAGITSTTPDPAHGRIERDRHGEPTGTLHEGAMDLVSAVVPATSDAELDAALLEAQRHLHTLGITGWQDAIVGDYAGMSDPGPAYRRAARSGRLSAHVSGALWWDRERGAEQLAELVGRRAELSHGRFRAATVKIMQDGIVENFTAAMSDAYLSPSGTATANRGHSFIDPVALRAYVRSLDELGFQIHVHAIGDRAISEALDAFEGTRRERRHQIAHLQVVRPPDVSRFARFGVAANMQMLWAVQDAQMVELTLPFLGAERAGWQYPFAALQRAGARLAAGSDWPVSSPDPLLAIHVGVNRVALGESTPPLLPDQAVSLECAFAAYTSGSAWVTHRDDAGGLRPGAVADLVTLDRDPFRGRRDEIGATRVTSCWIDGTLVHESGLSG